MYQKVHLQLTFLCTGITAAIMIVMSLIYLNVSEKNLYRNQFNSFKNDMNTISTNLEQQSVITMEWLSKMEAQGNYSFFLLDNGIPFLYNQLTDLSDSGKKALLNDCLNYWQNTLEIVPAKNSSTSSLYNSYHVEFEFSSGEPENDYFGSVIELDRNDSLLQVIILSSLRPLEKQITGQRIRFLFIDAAAVLLLTVFSFLFTGRLLKPVIENQKKQVSFVASASHELRTPLAVILSSAECCQNASPKEQAVFLKNIKQEGMRMSMLIDDMLDLTGIESRQFPVRARAVELDTLILDLYDAFDPLAKRKSISLSLSLPENTLPVCTCDPDRIKQAVSILLHNALSYTREQGHIRMSLSHSRKVFLISVSDDGIGISDEDKKKIFDRFYRAEKSRSTKGHFGLGLSIASEILSAHHGSISVENSPEGGSLFTITLPENSC